MKEEAENSGISARGRFSWGEYTVFSPKSIKAPVISTTPIIAIPRTEWNSFPPLSVSFSISAAFSRSCRCILTTPSITSRISGRTASGSVWGWGISCMGTDGSAAWDNAFFRLRLLRNGFCRLKNGFSWGSAGSSVCNALSDCMSIFSFLTVTVGRTWRWSGLLIYLEKNSSRSALLLRSGAEARLRTGTTTGSGIGVGSGCTFRIGSGSASGSGSDTGIGSDFISGSFSSSDSGCTS